MKEPKTVDTRLGPERFLTASVEAFLRLGQKRSCFCLRVWLPHSTKAGNRFAAETKNGNVPICLAAIKPHMVNDLLQKIIIETRIHDQFEQRYASRFAPNFDPINLFSINEMQLSNLLAHLLYPAGTHAQGDLFLRLFLKQPGWNWPIEATAKLLIFSHPKFCTRTSVAAIYGKWLLMRFRAEPEH